MQDTYFKKILLFTVIAYTVTSAISFCIYFLYTRGYLTQDQITFYHSFTAFGPGLAAMITTFIFYGKEGVKKLFSKISIPNLDRTTYLIILSPVLLFVVGIFVYAYLRSEWYDFRSYANKNWTSIYSIVVWLLPMLIYSIFGEIGWRGFLLPHLQEKYNAWLSTVILTVIWGIWHIPFFFYRFDFSSGVPIGFFLGLIVGATIATYIFNSSRGFLIPLMVFVFLTIICSQFDTEVIVNVLSTGLILIVIFIFRKFGSENLSLLQRTRNYFLNPQKVILLDGREN